MSQTKWTILGIGLIIAISLGLWLSYPDRSRAALDSTTIFPTNGRPGFIVTGSDGNLWFTEPNDIGRITITGTLTEYPLLDGDTDPWHITAGPDGNIWFTLPKQNKVGIITPSGVITDITGIAWPQGITTGPDNNIWITQGVDQIASITTTGIITAFSIAWGSAPDQIISGSDGNLWYVITVDYKGGMAIGRMTLQGASTWIDLPTWDSGIFDLALGGDGNVWFTEGYANNIARITPTGTVTEFPLPLTPIGIHDNPVGITIGPDDAIWFLGDGRIGRMNLSGGVGFFPDSGGWGITTGPDGNIWFTDYWDQYVGRLHINQYLFPVIMRH